LLGEYRESVAASGPAARRQASVTDGANEEEGTMTSKPKTRETPVARALARHVAAQAALDAVPGPVDYPKHLSDEEDDALYELAFTPCISDAEFLEKLRFLVARDTRIFGAPHCDLEFGPIAVAANLHFNQAACQTGGWNQPENDRTRGEDPERFK
jgi:hypothetical protein